MLHKPDIPLIHVNLFVTRTCHQRWQGLLSRVVISVILDGLRKQNHYKISKKSALTVSQQLSINQQQSIGMAGLALAGSCQ
jgi:hypothetical protein